jgi:flagellar hook-associated protein 1 FlgK
MRSTFMGLEASKRGLYTQQSALYTTGHNIANANTEGYSRQRVNMEPTLGYPGTGLNAPKVAGFIGTGVKASSVQRIRDAFVDRQYRQETNKLGYWETRYKSISQLEDILNEPSDYGLAKALDGFWNSLQDLHVHPEDGGARTVVVQRAIAVADSFHYIYNSIQQLRENAANEIGITLRDINSVLEQIAHLNYQIQSVEPNGYMPNDLYDERDKLLDQLSTYIPIELEYEKSGGNALAIAEGSVRVFLKLSDGTKVKLVDGKDFAQLRNFDESTSDGLTPTKSVEGFKIVRVDESGNEIVDNNWNVGNSAQIDINKFSNLGKLKSLVDSYGYDINGNQKGLFPENLEKINKLAKGFAEAFNKLHGLGTDLDGDPGVEFFVKNNSKDKEITAGNIYVSNTIINSPNKIAASDLGNAEPGNGNAEPGNGNAEPGNGNAEPGNGNAEPGNGNAELGNGNAEPGNGNAEPGNGNAEPGNGNAEPGNGNAEPGNGNAEPGNGKAEPGNGNAEPGNGNAEPGNGKNALALANLKFQTLDGLRGASIQSYFEGFVGQLGVDGQQAERLTYNAQTLQQSVSERRSSISSVSLDEEMTNMIAFQQAYNANARMITAIDETLDKIINGMGRVGL